MASIFPYKPLRVPAYVVIASALVELVTVLGVLALSAALPTSRVVGVLTGVNIASTFVRFGTFIALSYRANASLRALTDPPLAYTPAGMVGWYVVPLLGFYRPYAAMREVLAHIGTARDTFGVRLHGWWLTFLVYQILMIFARTDAAAIFVLIASLVHMVFQCALVKLLSDRMDTYAARMKLAAAETVSVFA